jgi:hypothetical protein
MKRGTPDHPKVLMLANKLKMPRFCAVGLLECLWHFTARYAAQGDIGKYGNDNIAAAVDWRKDPDDLIEALVATKFLDRSEKYRLVVHDWSDHSDDTCNTYLLRANLCYCDGKPARRKDNRTKKENKSPDAVGTNPDMREKCPVNQNQYQNQNHTHHQAVREGESDLSNGDEAHRILKSRPELSLLTWEQDIAERKNVASLAHAGEQLDFVAAAKWIANEAITAGPRDAPGYWLRKQYHTYFTKNTTLVAGQENPLKRMFIVRKNDGNAADLQ